MEIKLMNGNSIDTQELIGQMIVVTYYDLFNKNIIDKNTDYLYCFNSLEKIEKNQSECYLQCYLTNGNYYEIKINRIANIKIKKVSKNYISTLKKIRKNIEKKNDLKKARRLEDEKLNKEYHDLIKKLKSVTYGFDSSQVMKIIQEVCSEYFNTNSNLEFELSFVIKNNENKEPIIAGISISHTYTDKNNMYHLNLCDLSYHEYDGEIMTNTDSESYKTGKEKFLKHIQDNLKFNEKKNKIFKVDERSGLTQGYDLEDIQFEYCLILTLLKPLPLSKPNIRKVLKSAFSLISCKNLSISEIYNDGYYHTN